jgi:hypothetical protein
MALHNSWSFPGVFRLIGVGMLMVTIGIVFALVEKFTMDFAVPIMFLRGRRCLESWSELRQLLAANPGRFVLYLLFYLVLDLAIGMLLLAVVLGTCCVAGCFLAIPYLGTVLLLPVLVFKRAYSLHYLAQYGPEYDVFSPASASGVYPAPA